MCPYVVEMTYVHLILTRDDPTVVQSTFSFHIQRSFNIQVEQCPIAVIHLYNNLWVTSNLIHALIFTFLAWPRNCSHETCTISWEIQVGQRG